MESIKYSFLPSILTRQAEAEAAILAIIQLKSRLSSAILI